MYFPRQFAAYGWTRTDSLGALYALFCLSCRVSIRVVGYCYYYCNNVACLMFKSCGSLRHFFLVQYSDQWVLMEWVPCMWAFVFPDNRHTIHWTGTFPFSSLGSVRIKVYLFLWLFFETKIEWGSDTIFVIVISYYDIMSRGRYTGLCITSFF